MSQGLIFTKKKCLYKSAILDLPNGVVMPNDNKSFIFVPCDVLVPEKDLMESFSK